MSITYYHSSEQMYEVSSESVALVVTSPPYPMIAKWDKCFGKVDFEYQHDILQKVWQECYRVLIPGGICCINIGDATRKIDGNFQCFPNYAKITTDCYGIGFIPLIPIFWKKISNRPNAFLGSGFFPPNAYVPQDYEYIAIFRKGSLRRFPPRDSNRVDSSYSKEQRDLWFQQTWNIPGAKHAKVSSSFPEEIPYRLVCMFSVFGDTVLDPFCEGRNCTTERVTLQLKRKFIGYEIKKDVD